MVTIDPEILRRNLEALGRFCPDVAAQVAGAAVPGEFAAVEGTDGTATFARVVGEERRRVEWLGGTSMPRESAEALVAGLEPGASSGLGLGMGTGFEWAAFVRRLPTALGLYVYEPEVGLLRMALAVGDLSEWLGTGRVVLLTGVAEAAGEGLERFLEGHLGFEPPSVLHPLPTIGGRRNALVRAGEGVVRRAVGARAAVVERLAAAVRQARCGQGTLALVVTPRYPGERPLREELGGARAVRIDRHESASLALRIKELAEHRPGKVVSDLFRGQLGCVPDAIPVETWVPPLAGPAYWERVPAANMLQGHDRVVVHGGLHEARLAAQGIPAGQIELRPLRAPAGLVRRAGVSKGTKVALFGDLPRCDMAALAIGLPTHQAVFAAACELVAANYLSVHYGAASDVLRRALLRAGVAAGTKDPGLGEAMLRIIRDVLIAAVPPLTLARALVEQGVEVMLLGDWPGVEAGERLMMQPMGAAGFPSFEEVGLLVHLSPHGVVSPCVWEAVAAGLVIVSPEHATDGQGGSLAKLLEGGVDYARPRGANLVGTIRSLLRDEGRRRALVESARGKLRG